MHSISTSSQDTGYFLISQLVDELLDVCGEENRARVEARLSAVLSLYEIRPKAPEAGNPDVVRWTKQFIAAKKLEGYSPNTTDSYELELRIFAENVTRPLDEINTPDIRLYLSEYDHLKPSSRAKKLTILRSFFNWLVEEEILAINPIQKIKPPKQEKRMPKALTIEDLEMLREFCATPRDRAFLEVFYATGGRLEEVQQLDKRDIDWRAMSTRVIGKGDKERTVYLSVRAAHHLKRYLESRDDDCPALFVTERKPYRRLSKRGIQKVVKAIAARAGIEKNVHPHVFRHTFATLLLENGAEMAILQQLLGHASPVSTMVYTNVTDAKKQETHRKYLIQ